MRLQLQQKINVFRDWAAVMFDGPQALAFLPALVLGGFWLGGEPVLLFLALAMPFCIALISYSGLSLPSGLLEPGVSGAPDDLESFSASLDLALRDARKTGRCTACFVIEIGGLERIGLQTGDEKAHFVRTNFLRRLHTVTREHDCACLLANDRIGFVISPLRHITAADGLRLAKRIRRTLEAGRSGRAPHDCKVAIGLAISDLADRTSGQDLLDEAMLALQDARLDPTNAIRAYEPEIRHVSGHMTTGEARVMQALEGGEILPWFQPQVSNETGQISGFEALARWLHPQRGTISPVEFLPVLESAGQMERLGEVILRHSCEALRSWDENGYVIPQVGVNFTVYELANPALIDKIAWELDRCDLAPSRICVEILETVVASSADDALTGNIRRLSEMGCRIDLDDFGTAHASMTSIRRFSVQRLKIDRTFVARVDRDPEQQRMVSAILLMAEQLGLETLAEGVETAGEHALLAQLGCGYAQGFGIGRPMPFNDTFDWIEGHQAKVQPPPKIGRKSGENGL